MLVTPSIERTESTTSFAISPMLSASIFNIMSWSPNRTWASETKASDEASSNTEYSVPGSTSKRTYPVDMLMGGGAWRLKFPILSENAYDEYISDGLPSHTYGRCRNRERMYARTGPRSLRRYSQRGGGYHGNSREQ